MAEIDRLGANLDLLDRYVVYPVAIAIMRERVLTLAGRFDWIYRQPDWGPGRVDTFNSAKVIFNFPMDDLPARGACRHPPTSRRSGTRGRDKG